MQSTIARPAAKPARPFGFGLCRDNTAPRVGYTAADAAWAAANLNTGGFDPGDDRGGIEHRTVSASEWHRQWIDDVQLEQLAEESFATDLIALGIRPF